MCIVFTFFQVLGTAVVLDSMDLDIYQGETMVILGPNGSGKTTLMKVLTGEYPPSFKLK